MTDAGGISTTRVWQLPRPWLTAVLVGLGVFAVTAITIWLLDTSSEQKDAVVAPPTTSVGVKARIVTIAALQSLADARGRPVYWAGERPGTSLEYTQTTDGNVYVRYLTGSAKAGDKGRATSSSRRTYSRMRFARAVDRAATTPFCRAATERRDCGHRAEERAQCPPCLPGRAVPDRGLRPDCRRSTSNRSQRRGQARRLGPQVLGLPLERRLMPSSPLALGPIRPHESRFRRGTVCEWS